MSKAYSFKASWIFVLLMIVAGAMIMTEDSSATREAQAAVAVGGEVARGPGSGCSRECRRNSYLLVINQRF